MPFQQACHHLEPIYNCVSCEQLQPCKSILIHTHGNSVPLYGQFFCPLISMHVNFTCLEIHLHTALPNARLPSSRHDSVVMCRIKSWACIPFLSVWEFWFYLMLLSLSFSIHMLSSLTLAHRTYSALQSSDSKHYIGNTNSPFDSVHSRTHRIPDCVISYLTDGCFVCSPWALLMDDSFSHLLKHSKPHEAKQIVTGDQHTTHTEQLLSSNRSAYID